MALVLLPGLSNLIDDISEEKKLPPQVVEAALREALQKGFARLPIRPSIATNASTHRSRLQEPLGRPTL